MGYNFERVNFGKYLENVRQSHDVSIDELSEGLCNRSLISRIESGERVSTMLLRDRLIERCGATSDEYEKYVKVDEFKKWKQRAAIIADIEAKKYVEAKMKLNQYGERLGQSTKDGDRDSLEEQFYLDVKTMIARIEGEGTSAALAERALRKTVEIDCDGFVTSPRLSPKEINLAIEYSRGMEKKKRCEQLARLLKYVEEHKPDKRNMVMFYPKLVYEIISENIYDHKGDSAWLAGALELSDRASELLFETNRLMYIIELTEVKKQLWEYILALPGCAQSVGYEKFLEGKRKNDNEFLLWNRLGEVYKVETHTDDWCYIHYEGGVKCIGEVIKKRRMTIGISRDNLCEGICSTDSIKRCESLVGDIQPQKLLLLFGKLGLQKEYQTTFVTAPNLENKQSEERIMQLGNTRKYDEALLELQKLDERIKLKTPEDNQFIMMFTSMMRLRKREVSPEKCYDELYNALMLTLPTHVECEEYYLTRMELVCIYNMVIINNGKVSNTIEKLVRDIYNNLQINETSSDTMLMELFALAMHKIYMFHDDCRNSERSCDYLIRLELTKKRNVTIHQALNEKILLHNKMKKIGEKDIEKKIARNDFFIDGIMEYKQTNKCLDC